jgi:ubiquinone/menaquinone biosynthesis C-methylase UbiE
MPEKRIPAEMYDDEYYFSPRCPGYEFHQRGEFRLSNLYRHAFRYARLEEGMHILDFGCGRGELLYHAARAGCFAIGVDYSDSALKFAKRLLEKDEVVKSRTKLLKASAGQLPLDDASWDRIFMMDVIEHLYPDEEDAVLAEFYRLLKPEGVLLIHTPNRLDYDLAWKYYTFYVVSLVRLLQRRKREFGRDKRTDNEKEFHINEKDPFELKRKLLHVGFSRVRIKAKNIYEAAPFVKKMCDEGFRYLRPITYFYPLNYVFAHSLFAIAKK